MLAKNQKYKGIGVHDPDTGEAHRVYDSDGMSPPLKKSHPLFIRTRKVKREDKNGNFSK